MGNKRKKKDTMVDKYQIDLYGWSNYEEFVWLIKWLFNRSKIFCLINNSQLDFGEKAYEFLNKMKPFLIEDVEVNEWPGTVWGGNMHGDVAIEYRFKCNDNARKIFLHYVQSFEELCSPNMFEDLSFYSSVEDVIFYSVIHEGMKHIVNLEKSDVDFLLANISISKSCVTTDKKDYVGFI